MAWGNISYHVIVREPRWNKRNGSYLSMLLRGYQEWHKGSPNRKVPCIYIQFIVRLNIRYKCRQEFKIELLSSTNEPFVVAEVRDFEHHNQVRMIIHLGNWCTLNHETLIQRFKHLGNEVCHHRFCVGEYAATGILASWCEPQGWYGGLAHHGTISHWIS